MKDMEWTHIDKSDWGPGQWQDEPDKMQYTDEETGLPCLIVRNPGGALCGYVGIGRSHPYYGKTYLDIERDIEVHGGLTYSDFCVENQKEHGICHITEPGEEEPLWWFGFDCAHAGDLCPSYVPSYRFGEDRYRGISYVKREINRLAKQLKDADGSPKNGLGN